jgi:multidrug efflux system membrane fusion protein
MPSLPTSDQPLVSPSPKRRRRSAAVIGIIVLVLGFAWWLSHRRKPGSVPEPAAAGARPGIGPQPVTVQAAAPADINLYLEGLGSVTPLASVIVRTQISGYLTEIAFAEGQMVKKGDLLAVIDPRPYQVALLQSQGQLRQARAQLTEAKLDLARYERLALKQSIAKQTVDTQRATVDQDEGLVQTDEAAVANAQLSLDYCHVTAPVAGQIGLRAIDVGNYVTAGDSGGLVVLNEVQPISVVFTLPEQVLPQVGPRLRSQATIPVTAFDQGRTHALATGKLIAIDNQVDPTTGTFRLRALFPNDDLALYALQFVNVRMLLNVDRNVLVIPTSGVERNQQGALVYVVKPDNTVTARRVALGPVDGERVEVISGITQGERVVVDGADRLNEGMPVTVQDRAARP